MPTVLVIDDDPSLRRLLKIQLTRGGKYEVAEAEDGPSGFNLAKKLVPDLIVLDLNLPGENGFRILKNIREDRSICLVPVIVLTGDDDAESVRTALSDYAEQYMIKPVDMKYIEKRIDEILAVRAPATGETGADKWKM